MNIIFININFKYNSLINFITYVDCYYFQTHIIKDQLTDHIIVVSINLFVGLYFVMNCIVVNAEVGDVVGIIDVVNIDQNIYLMLVFNINGNLTILPLEVFNYILSFHLFSHLGTICIVKSHFFAEVLNFNALNSIFKLFY